MATQTPNLGLYKPEQADTVGATIGTHLPANFDIIDNLAAQPNSYASGVSGFTPDSIKAALDALAGARIVEMGSNSNGEYVRWENGLQVCYNKEVYVGMFSNVLYETLPFVWAYPSSFISIPHMQATTTYPGGDSDDAARFTIAIITASPTTSSSAKGYMKDLVGGARTLTVSIIAIGRWK